MSASASLNLGWSLTSPPPVREAPILALRALRYIAEGHPGLLPPIAGLRVRATGIEAGAEWDPATGQFRFAHLPPGPRRLLITDPERRVLPMAVEVLIPSRYPARPTAAPLPEGPPPRLTLKLRPAPERAVPPDVTAVIGRVLDSGGRGVALARLSCATVLNGGETSFVTWSAPDGAFLLLLPGEDRAAAPLARALTLHLPMPGLARALAADFWAALPAESDSAALFQPSTFRLHAADGTPAEAPEGLVPLRPGRSIRWDIVTPGH